MSCQSAPGQYSPLHTHSDVSILPPPIHTQIPPPYTVMSV
ncbi:unnamed protein product, partial [Staurois parvus]